MDITACTSSSFNWKAPKRSCPLPLSKAALNSLSNKACVAIALSLSLDISISCLLYFLWYFLANGYSVEALVRNLISGCHRYRRPWAGKTWGHHLCRRLWAGKRQGCHRYRHPWVDLLEFLCC